MIQCLVLIQVDKHPEFNGTLKVTVKIKDVDDKNPKFTHIHYTANIPENVIIFDEDKLKNLKEGLTLFQLLKVVRVNIRLITVSRQTKQHKVFFLISGVCNVSSVSLTD